MLSLEEPADRLAARLVAAGTDLDAVEILGDVEGVDDEGRPFQRRWQLPGDCGVLEAAIAELDVEVVTIDGLGYAVAGNSHNYANVGSALSALSGVAERTGAVILGLTHPPKGNTDAVTAAIGSTAWTAVARISWVVGLDPSDEAKLRRVVRPAPGSNYRLPDHGLSFLIAEHDASEAGFITGLGESDVAAEDITSPPEPDSPEELSKLDEAQRLRTAHRGRWPGASEQGHGCGQGGRHRRSDLAAGQGGRGRSGPTERDGRGPDWWWEHDGSPSGQAWVGKRLDQDLGHMDSTLFEQGFCQDEDGLTFPSGQGPFVKGPWPDGGPVGEERP